MRPRLAGPRKAAIALTSMQEDVAAAVLAKLGPSALWKLKREMEALGEVEDDVVLEVLDELTHNVSTPLAMARTSAPAYLRRLAQRAFGEERANELLTSALPKQDPLQLLREAPPDAMAQLLKEEHPAVVTVVLTQLPARNVAAILAAMPRELTADLLARLAGVSHVPEQAVAEISQTLAHALSAAGPAADSGSSEGFDGQAFADAVSRELQHARGGRGDDLATASEPLVAKLRGAS